MLDEYRCVCDSVCRCDCVAYVAVSGRVSRWLCLCVCGCDATIWRASFPLNVDHYVAPLHQFQHSKSFSLLLRKFISSDPHLVMCVMTSTSFQISRLTTIFPGSATHLAIILGKPHDSRSYLPHRAITRAPSYTPNHSKILHFPSTLNTLPLTLILTPLPRLDKTHSGGSLIPNPIKLQLLLFHTRE